MKLAKVQWKGETIWAEIDSDRMYRLEGDRFGKSNRLSQLGSAIEAKLLAPLEPVNKIVGLLGNYGEKGKRNGPGIFVKPYSTTIAQGEMIVFKEAMVVINYEPELGVVIGKRAKNVPLAKAMDFVFGYTVCNDVTSFPVQKEDGALSTRFKTYDSFGPVGPWIMTGLNGGALRVQSRLNGVTKQDDNTKNMAFNIAEAIAWVTAVMTLEPGDIISTGTPPGNGEMKPGDTIECEVEGIGVLKNHVIRV